MHFHHMTDMTTSKNKNLCPEDHEIYNFGRLFLGHDFYKLVSIFIDKLHVSSLGV